MIDKDNLITVVNVTESFIFNLSSCNLKIGNFVHLKFNTMPKGIYKVPTAVNEPIKSYAAGSAERKELQAMLKELRSKEIDIPMYIGGKEVRSDNKSRLAPPHDHKHTLGHFHKSDKTHVTQAIDAALAAKEKWGKFKLGTPCFYLFTSG
jgi:hypothetical protein